MAIPSELQLGYVAGAHGVRGALRVKLFNADSAALHAGLELSLRPRGATAGDPEQRTERLSRVAPKPGSDLVRLWLESVDSREQAEALRGWELWVQRGALPELEGDEFYLADLVGLPVEREHEGRREGLGEITGISTNTMQDLLCVELGGREWLVPAMPPFIVEIEPGVRVLVDVHLDMLPEGATPILLADNVDRSGQDELG